MPQNVQPLTVLDDAGAVIDTFPYDGGETVSKNITIPSNKTNSTLSIARGYLDYSPTAGIANLPFVTLGNARRYVAATPSQWFTPMADLQAATTAYWKLEESTGTAFDATPNGHNLSENGGTTSASLGKIGMCRNFNDNEWLQAVDSTAFQVNGSFTVWCWCLLSSTTNYRTLFTLGDAITGHSTGNWVVHAGGMIASVGTTQKTLTISEIPSDNLMHFVVAWYDSVAQSINMQVDMGSITTVALGGAINTTPFNFAVGGISANSRGWFGRMDEAGYANVVLGPRFTQMLWNNNFGEQYPF